MLLFSCGLWLQGPLKVSQSGTLIIYFDERIASSVAIASIFQSPILEAVVGC